jgi:hypothetical protein
MESISIDYGIMEKVVFIVESDEVIFIGKKKIQKKLKKSIR